VNSHRADQDPVCPPNPDKEKNNFVKEIEESFEIFWNILFRFQNEIYFELV
jgi:hypothetical protein